MTAFDYVCSVSGKIQTQMATGISLGWDYTGSASRVNEMDVIICIVGIDTVDVTTKAEVISQQSSYAQCFISSRHFLPGTKGISGGHFLLEQGARAL